MTSRIRIFQFVRLEQVSAYEAAGWFNLGCLEGCHHGRWSALCEWPEWWLPIPGYEGAYEISSHGRVRSLDRVLTKPWATSGYPRTIRGREIIPSLAKGYLHVRLSDNAGRKSSAYVAHLVALAFIGPKPSGAFVCHNDGDPLNNAAFNIRYDTKAGNEADKLRHGTLIRGSESHFAKLTEAQVTEIRSMAGQATQTEIARKFGISQSNVSMIVNGVTWQAMEWRGDGPAPLYPPPTEAVDKSAETIET